MLQAELTCEFLTIFQPSPRHLTLSDSGVAPVAEAGRKRGAPFADRRDPCAPAASGEVVQAAITSDDVEAARSAGVNDNMLEEAVWVSALFHVINRVMDAAGAGPLEGRSLEVARRVVMGRAYTLPAPIRYLSRSG